jgi:hypothetical protein
VITFVCAIAEHFIGANFTGWLYVLPAFMDLALIGRASVIVVKK